MQDLKASSEQEAARWLSLFFKLFAVFALLGVLILGPFSLWWLYQSGDLSAKRAVQAQQTNFALFGSALTTPNSTLAYKKLLAESRKPTVVVLGSENVLAMRQEFFAVPMLNMGAKIASLAELEQSLDAVLAVHKPELVLIGLDFWWFSRDWAQTHKSVQLPKKDPFRFSLDSVRLPWQLLTSSTISVGQFFAFMPIENRFGVRARFANDGFGPDGSWYASSLLTSSQSQDAQFAFTLDTLARGTGRFTPQSAIDPILVEAFADIYFYLRSQGIMPVVYLTPIAPPVYEALTSKRDLYPQLFSLHSTLLNRGIEVFELSDGRYLNSVPCEYMSGTRGGDVVCCRILRELASQWNGLQSYLNMSMITKAMTEWKGHAAIARPELDILEQDFLGLGCVKRTR